MKTGKPKKTSTSDSVLLAWTKWRFLPIFGKLQFSQKEKFVGKLKLLRAFNNFYLA